MTIGGLILIILIVWLLWHVGGFFLSGPVGILLLILLILWATGNLHT